MSLVHGGPPPNFLSPTVFSLLVGNSANPALEDIADLELFEKVRKVSICLFYKSYSELKIVCVPVFFCRECLSGSVWPLLNAKFLYFAAILN